MTLHESSNHEPRRRWVRVALWIAALGLVAYAVVLWIASSHFIGARHQRRGPEQRHEGFEDITAATSDGLTLRGSTRAPPDPRGILVFFHGIGSSRNCGCVAMAASWGLAGAAFDFRAHGSSDGEVTAFGWDERRDVEAILRTVRQRWPGKKVAVWGVSLGGAALCYAADVVRDVDAVVIESAYRDIDSAFDKRVVSQSPLLLPFAAPVKWIAAWRVGLDRSLLRPVDFIAKLRPERTMVTTGGEDPWAGPDDLGALTGALPGCTQYVVPGAHHDDVWSVGGEAFVNRVRAFIEARLQ